jgi:hypothetical protein
LQARVNLLYTLTMKHIFFIIILFSFSLKNTAQPVWDTRQILDSFMVFKDWKQPNLWYYAPGDLKLKIKADGNPDFQMTSLRYTGQNLTGNKGELRYRNIIQLTVQMETYSIDDLLSLRKRLKLPQNVKLQPLPINNLETYLLTSAGTSGNKKLGKLTTNSSKSGEKGVFWTERNFSLALDNYEAQLIDEQLKNNRLALSFAYSFSAELMPGKVADLSITGDSSLIKQIGISKDDVETTDSTLTDMIVKGNTFGIYINLAENPDAVKKIDINENYMPPAYAVLSIYCYDFKDNVRPDIFFKAIELEAVGVSGEPVRTQVKFAQKQPDLNNQSVQFEYAVKMNKPLRYRIIETNKNGQKTTSEWKTLQQWKPMIDISSNADDLGIDTRNLDFELSAEDIKTANLLELNIWLRYTFLGKPITEMVYIKPNENEGIFKSISLRNDKKTPIQYQFIYRKTDKSVQKNYWRTITNDYVQLKVK